MSDPQIKPRDPTPEYLDAVASMMAVRPAVPEDYAFIFNAWLRSYAKNGGAKSIAPSFFFTNHHKLVDDIVQRSKILVAVDVNDPSQIFGFVVGEKVEGAAVFHYIYVKHVYREIGIAARLMIAMSSVLDHDLNVAGICSHLPGNRIRQAAANRNLFYSPYAQYPTDWKKSPPLDIPKTVPSERDY